MSFPDSVASIVGVFVEIDGSPGIPHGSKVKIRLRHSDGWSVDVLPAWTKYAVANSSTRGVLYDAVHWDPPPCEQYSMWVHIILTDAINFLRFHSIHNGVSFAFAWFCLFEMLPSISEGFASHMLDC